MQVFFLRGHPAPDVPLLLIDVQHPSGPGRQIAVDLHEAFCHILMYRTFAYPEPFCRLPHCRICLNDIIRNLNCPFFYIFFQGKSPEHAVCTVYAPGEKAMQTTFLSLSEFYRPVVKLPPFSHQNSIFPNLYILTKVF